MNAKETPLTDGEIVIILQGELQHAWGFYRAAKAELDVRGATIRMACDRLGGSVEGRSPQPGNFLQRIDELVGLESELLAARSRERTIREWAESIIKFGASHTDHPMWRDGQKALAESLIWRLAAAPSAERVEPPTPMCPKCSTVMVQTFDYRRVNAIAETATPNGGFTCFKCGYAIAPAERGEPKA